ncbi:MAG: DUF4197 domain-containing protein [Burkholderiales bacterium]|nr:DUF4197 domain-containing protein [Burkholderiales bacterium]
MLKRLAFVASIAFAGSAHALSVADLTNQETVQGLKEALAHGAGKAVAQLGTTNGFLGNAKVKIPLPESLQRVEHVMRVVGMGKQADELVTSMNHAAEMAVKEAEPLLVDAVKKMSVQDAKGILTGGDDAATQYFRRTTSDGLTKKFLPIVKQMTAKVNLAQLYNQYAGQAAKFGVIDAKDANIDDYVTRKALDGLYLVIAEQERAIRKDPVGAASKIVQKVFGAVK